MNFVNCYENLGNLAMRRKESAGEEIASHNRSYIEHFSDGNIEFSQGFCQIQSLVFIDLCRS